MQRFFYIPLAKPSSWVPPYVEETSEESEVPLEFILAKNWGGNDLHYYRCNGCYSAGGEVDDIFCTSSRPEAKWPHGDGVPVALAHEMYAHARQHEIMWRWAVNRIPQPKYDT
jgi:hypothetical protein